MSTKQGQVRYPHTNHQTLSRLAVEKVDYQNTTQKLDADFSIFAAGDSGELDYTAEPVAQLCEIYLEGAEGYKSAELELNKLYYLVETRSPAGYQILPQPVLFTLTKDEPGNVQMQFYYPGTQEEITQSDGLIGVIKKDGAESAKIAYLQVADVTVGELPQTSGRGVLPYMMLASVLIGLGLLVSRRNLQSARI